MAWLREMTREAAHDFEACALREAQKPTASLTRSDAQSIVEMSKRSRVTCRFAPNVARLFYSAPASETAPEGAV